MRYTSFGINLFTFFRLPAAWISGVRLISINKKICKTRVNHKWINQNPFNSIYWAVQGMAAELTTGILIMKASKEFEKEVSMLVISNKAKFIKKAKGKIIFSCIPKDKIEKTFEKLIKTNEPQKLWLTSNGIDIEGDLVSTFDFQWTLLIKK